MTEDQKHLLQIQLYNTFNNDRVIAWEPLVKEMAGTYGLDRETVLTGMNDLIDQGRIAILLKDTYCQATAQKRIEAREGQPKPNNTMSRASFDLLTPQEKMDFTNAGGTISP